MTSYNVIVKYDPEKLTVSDFLRIIEALDDDVDFWEWGQIEAEVYEDSDLFHVIERLAALHIPNLQVIMTMFAYDEVVSE